MTREQKIEEAIRIRPSKAAMAALREDLEVQEMMAHTKRDMLVAGGLRVLIEMADKLP